MNEKAAELGLQSHALRGSVGPALRQRLVGLRHGAADHPRVGDERIGSIMRTPAYTVQTDDSARSRSTSRTICSAAPTSTCARARPASSRSPATAWRRCSGCRKAVRKWRSSSSARDRTRAASWNRRTSSTGCRQKPPRSSPRKRPFRSSRTELDALFPTISLLHRGRVERQRGDRVHRTITGRARVSRVVGLQIPPAHVARIHAVPSVARRKRRD